MFYFLIFLFVFIGKPLLSDFYQSFTYLETLYFVVRVFLYCSAYPVCTKMLQQFISVSRILASSWTQTYRKFKGQATDAHSSPAPTDMSVLHLSPEDAMGFSFHKTN